MQVRDAKVGRVHPDTTSGGEAGSLKFACFLPLLLAPPSAFIGWLINLRWLVVLLPMVGTFFVVRDAVKMRPSIRPVNLRAFGWTAAIFGGWAALGAAVMFGAMALLGPEID